MYRDLNSKSAELKISVRFLIKTVKIYKTTVCVLNLRPYFSRFESVFKGIVNPSLLFLVLFLPRKISSFYHQSLMMMMPRSFFQSVSSMNIRFDDGSVIAIYSANTALLFFCLLRRGDQWCTCSVPFRRFSQFFLVQ